MAEYHERLSEAREHIRPRWTPEREREIEHRVTRALRRPRFHAVRAAALVITLAAACALLWQGTVAPGARETRVATLARLRPIAVPLLVLEDGSRVQASGADARLRGLHVTPSAVTIELVSGAAHFEITPNSARTFRVRARDATVSVLGTVFDVALRGDALEVVVSRGRVRVEQAARQRELSAGERLTWTLSSSEAVRASPSPPAGSANGRPPRALPRAAASRAVEEPSSERSPNSWRELAERRQYQAAFERLRADGFDSLGEDPGDLLLAADVARLSGHAANAVPLLERVAARGAADARAALASFALGRVLLDDLGQPARAASAFRRAYELSPRGALAEDALRREIASLRRAGQHDAAELRARVQREQFGNGDR